MAANSRSNRPSMRDRVREEAQKSTTEGAGYLNIPKGFKLYQSENGEAELDVIPYENNRKTHFRGYEEGELIPYFRFKIHKGIGAEDQKYVCPTSFGKPCPICEEVGRMRKSKNGDIEIIKSLAAKERFIMLIVDLKDKKNDAPQIWEESYHAFLKKLLADIDAAENSDNSRKRSRAHAGFAELEDGQTLIVTFEEKKGFKNFCEATRIDAENRDAYGEDILKDTTNLEDCLKVLSYEQLEAKFLEIDAEDQGANRKRDDKEKEKEEEKPSGRRGRSAETEEEPPPSRRRGAAAKEEAEEPPPSRRRGTAKEEPADEPPPSRRRGVAKEEEPEPETRSSRRGRTADPEPEQEEEKPAGRSRRGAAEKSKCYVPGGVFGKDCDTHQEETPTEDRDDPKHVPNCYNCPEEVWKECKALQIAEFGGK